MAAPRWAFSVTPRLIGRKITTEQGALAGGDE